MLYRTGHVDTVAGHALALPLVFQVFERRQKFGRDSRPLQTLHNVALHRDGKVTVLTPHHTRLPGKHRPGDLHQRDGAARGGGHIGTEQVGDGVALGPGLAQHHLNQLVTFTELAHRAARQGNAQGLRDRLAAHTQRPRLGLVHLQADGLDILVPVVVHTPGVAAGLHELFDFVSALTQDHRVCAHHTELHRVSHRRPVGQQLNAPAHLGKLTGQHRG